MALGRQVHHQIRIGLLNGCRSGLGVGEFHLQQPVALGRLRQHFDAGEVAGVAHLVQVEHQRLAACQQSAHHGAADEAGTARHQDAAAAGEQGLHVWRGGFRHGHTYALNWWMSGLGWAA